MVGSLSSVECIIQDFARQMLEAIAFLHSMKLVHTDLKVGRK